MECLYWNEKIEYADALYENYKLWQSLIYQEGWTNMKIPVSKQLKKYFEHKNIKEFLVANEGKYLLAVVYRDEGGMDMLPCFTETMKYGEKIEDGKKRFMQEELFSDSDVDFFAENKWRKQTIYSLYQNIKNINANIQNMTNDNGNDNRFEKLNLFVVIDKKEDAEDFINNWRSKRHNLRTLSERLHMIDLCIVEIKNFID